MDARVRRRECRHSHVFEEPLLEQKLTLLAAQLPAHQFAKTGTMKLVANDRSEPTDGTRPRRNLAETLSKWYGCGMKPPSSNLTTMIYDFFALLLPSIGSHTCISTYQNTCDCKKKNTTRTFSSLVLPCSQLFSRPNHPRLDTRGSNDASALRLRLRNSTRTSQSFRPLQGSALAC